jgi:hypothetical protein
MWRREGRRQACAKEKAKPPNDARAKKKKTRQDHAPRAAVLRAVRREDADFVFFCGFICGWGGVGEGEAIRCCFFARTPTRPKHLPPPAPCKQKKTKTRTRPGAPDGDEVALRNAAELARVPRGGQDVGQ